jgi:hypothetical protein
MKIGWVFSPLSGSQSKEFTSIVTEKLARDHQHQIEPWIPEGVQHLEFCAAHLYNYDIAVFNLELSPDTPLGTLDLVRELAERVKGIVILHGVSDWIPEKAVKNSIGIISASEKVLALATEVKMTLTHLHLDPALESASQPVVERLNSFFDQVIEEKFVRKMIDQVAREVQRMGIMESSPFYQRLSDKIQEIVG